MGGTRALMGPPCGGGSGAGTGAVRGGGRAEGADAAGGGLVLSPPGSISMTLLQAGFGQCTKHSAPDMHWRTREGRGSGESGLSSSPTQWDAASSSSTSSAACYHSSLRFSSLPRLGFAENE